MARNLFHWNELPNLDDKVVIKPPFDAPQTDDEILSENEKIKQEVEAYTGPTVEDIQREVKEYQDQFEVKKQQMLKEAQDEADLLFENSQRKADELVAHK